MMKKFIIRNSKQPPFKTWIGDAIILPILIL